MPLLKLLEGLRAPWLTKIMDTVTLMGDETFFMLTALIILWCVSKKWGFRMLFIGLAGTAANQLLKAIFLVPRPWVLDPSFTIVESAREGASGYSFPSGHTHSAVSVFGTLAAWLRKGWIVALCVFMALLVAFSRMYLGVHTPLDVGVSLALGTVMVLALTTLFRRADGDDRRTGWVMLGAVLLTVLVLLYVCLAPATERNIAEFDAHGVEDMWKLVGAACGAMLAWWLDARCIRFETAAPLWVQLVKVLGGALVVLGVQTGLKPVMSLLFGELMLANGVRYFLIALAGGALWPMVFRFLPGKKKAGEALPKA